MIDVVRGRGRSFFVNDENMQKERKRVCAAVVNGLEILRREPMERRHEVRQVCMTWCAHWNHEVRQVFMTWRHSGQ